MKKFEDILIYEDNHLLVVNKPAGLLVQGDRSGEETLLDHARVYLKEKYNKPGNVFVGLVHRLDRPASGVVALARTSKSASRISEQFRQRTVEKTYHAWVEGACSEQGRLEDYLVRENFRSRVGDRNEGKLASLTYQRLKFTAQRSLVEINLETGRHHQIRVQFSHHRHPVWGDVKYGAASRSREKRIALHAAHITIDHPTLRERKTFHAVSPVFWESFE